MTMQIRKTVIYRLLEQMLFHSTAHLAQAKLANKKNCHLSSAGADAIS